MTIKVGDMVKYQDQTVRVLQLDSGLLSGGQEIKLAGFGWLKRDNPNIELVKSISGRSSNDLLRRDIPKIEKDYYGTSWVDSMDKYVGKTVQVFNPHKSNCSGEVVSIHGWTFQIYHLEPVLDYDIV